MSVFVSYAREDRDLVYELVDDLREIKQQVWIDAELTAGQEWWMTVLKQIRDSRVFVFALSPASARSAACRAELGYAFALRRPIVPIKVAEVDVEVAPSPIPDLNVMEYVTKDKKSALAMTTAVLNAAATSPLLPDPLPDPPRLPASYATSLKAEIEAEHLAVSRQHEILELLKVRMQGSSDVDRRLARGLLTDLRARSDVGKVVAEQIDLLLAPPSTRQPGSARRRVLIAAAALIVAGVATAVVVIAWPHDKGDVLDASDLDNNYEAVMADEELRTASEISADRCPLGDMQAVATLADAAISGSIAAVPRTISIEVDPDADGGPLIDCSVEPARESNGPIDFGLQLISTKQSSARDALIRDGAQDAGSYRGGAIMELQQLSGDESDQFCGSYWVPNASSVVLGLRLTGDGCSTSASSAALKASLERMVQALGSFVGGTAPTESSIPSSGGSATADTTPAISDRLESGATLGPGQRLESVVGGHVLEMTADGRLVVSSPAGVWFIVPPSSRAVPNSIAFMQDDGNLVIYRTPDDTSAENSTYASNTSGAVGDYYLELRDDDGFGELVIVEVTSGDIVKRWSEAADDSPQTSQPTESSTTLSTTSTSVPPTTSADADVPSLKNKTETEARHILAGFGFVPSVSFISVPIGSTSDGRVIDQSPLAGTSAQKGSTVKITVGRSGPPPTTT
jgi:hypothetical protein